MLVSIDQDKALQYVSYLFLTGKKKYIKLYFTINL